VGIKKLFCTPSVGIKDRPVGIIESKGENKMQRVVPIENELKKLSKTIDELEWEGEETIHLEYQRERLVQRMIDGEVWEPTF